MAEEPVRLSKAVMALKACSRSEAEKYIAGGWVRVDGVVVEEPQFRVGAQKVTLDADASLLGAASVTLLLHKPVGMTAAQAAGLLVPSNHAADDASGIRTAKSHFAQLTPLLELPREASGLAVFSQDWRIVRKLNEDAAVIEQELIAEVSGEIAANGLERLGRGLVFEGRAMPPARVSWQNETRLRFALKGIAPEWVEWMVAQVGLKLTALKRIRIGRVPMAQLAPGQWRYLPQGERF
ncbi:MAG: rRNA pseudouridine synthase [Burkholderiales bacterium]|nr:rRNA pseudouridine synthase [Burkholderiales bacterium]